MDIPKIHESEYRFCLILWQHEPCEQQLGWKSTTTYTVLKRLSERGILQNENTVVTSLVSKDQVQAAEIDELVEKKFEGSVPTFLAAFTRRQKLSKSDLDELQAMIDRYREEAAD